jgi:hypothetical protein
VIRTSRRHQFLGRLSIVTTALLACACTGQTGTATSTTRSPELPVVHLSVTDAGRTVPVVQGVRLVVALDSTYWTFRPVAPGGVLRSVGPARVVPRLSHCVPGQGCGTITAEFQATAMGTGTVEATRTTCGEALRCTPGQGDYRVQVIVHSGST